jgi:tyrosinase
MVLLSILSSLAIVLMIATISGSFQIYPKAQAALSPSSCIDPPTRREWRALLPEERGDYIKAVKCLHNTLSTLTGRGSLYDDFVFVHMWVGQECTVFIDRFSSVYIEADSYGSA